MKAHFRVFLNDFQGKKNLILVILGHPVFIYIFTFAEIFQNSCFLFEAIGYGRIDNV